MQGVSVKQLADKFGLKCFTPGVDISNRMITTSDVNRPALELTGFFEHFTPERVQVVGMVEHSYLEQLDTKTRAERYNQLLERNPRDLTPDRIER